MMSSTNTDLIRRDPALPGLATLLYPEALVDALRRQAPGLSLGPARTCYIKYKPGTNCLVGYKLSVAGEAVDIHAKAFTRDSSGKLARARQEPGISGPLGNGRVILEDQCVVVSIFPNDRKVKSLPCFADAEAQARLLRQLLPDRPDLWAGAVEGLVYKPERRYVGRLSTKEGPRAALKVYTSAEYASAERNARAFQSGGLLTLAPLLGHSHELGILAFEWIEGQALSDALLDSALPLSLVSGVGAALSELHARSAEGLAPLSRATEAESLLEAARNVAWFCPPLAEQAGDLARRLASRLLAEPPVGQPVHGDFHARQVILSGDNVALLDLDRALKGDPMLDLGLFIAHLEREVVRGKLSASRVEPLASALLAGYRNANPRAQLYAAAEVLRLAPRFFRYAEPDWPQRIEASLARAAVILKDAEKRCRFSPRWQNPDSLGVPVLDPFGVKTDTRMPFLAQALDPDEAQHQLRHGAGKHCKGFHLRAIRVTRHKPGRRCLIEYDLELCSNEEPARQLTLLGKARARGTDLATCALYEALARAGFDAASTDGISAPMPAGVVPQFRMGLLRRVDGVPATGLLAGPGGPILARRLAEAAHKLHRAGIPATRRHTIADELAILRARLALVAEEQPAWRERLGRLLESCAQLGGSLRETPPRGIHRDFHPDQVLVDGDRLWMLDLDLYSQGDPALDAGNFLGHLIEWSLRAPADRPALGAAAAAFTERFLELAGVETKEAIEVYTTLTLARHIHISRQFPDRAPFTEAILNHCEERCVTRLQPTCPPRAT